MNKKPIVAIQKSVSKKRQQDAVDYLVRHKLILDYILSDYKNVNNYIKYTNQVYFYIDFDEFFRISHNCNLVVLENNNVFEMNDFQKEKIAFLIEFGGINNV